MNRTGCYCLTFKFPTVWKMTARWGDMGGWRSPICATLKMDGSFMETMHQVQREATEQIERLTQQMLRDAPMPVTDDILERTRHLNDLKSMAEETILQSVVLVER